ncbi:BZ3500_MvSof-1268-A1-R1_Chr1-1g01017 [Microbotryum saponariae]|uniref:BZ3500_MvSof-1268-A1-R1_Chr1-1g01017 protein n=1 Tax=Microbotryum saponariae TaxID=289078 RepID=A0A2X0L398_9BASI|nr:BZ3500_MvSof-1268-A1-R1_Chr1-1g01017 [Microbotryum saponariae]SCZ93191.1 BZ3501_MvSof-1269-A2-R1_Chr1-1g00614 [Microbotryum saponariae]
MASSSRALGSLQHHTSSTTNVNLSSTSLITPQLTALADPPPTMVDQHLFEYMMQEVSELTPCGGCLFTPPDADIRTGCHGQVIRTIITSEYVARERRIAYERQVEHDLKLARATSPATLNTSNGKTSAAMAPSVPSKSSASPPPNQDEADEAVRSRLDKMGFKVGWAMAEKLARDRPRFPSTPATTSTTNPVGASTLSLAPIPDPLEAVKFICKDLWIALYDKQIDNLRTNHRGVYVLHDNGLKPLLRLSGNAGPGQAHEVNRRVKFFLAFPNGIIRGALSNLGVPCAVSAESAGIPQCTSAPLPNLSFGSSLMG